MAQSTIEHKAVEEVHLGGMTLQLECKCAHEAAKEHAGEKEQAVMQAKKTFT